MAMLPSDVRPGDGEQITRLSCPDCPGVLTVEVEGAKGHLAFKCLIGHRYSISDLLVAKEERIEDRLWAALYAVRELAALLDDLRVYARQHVLSRTDQAFAERSLRAQAQVAALRTIIEHGRAVELHDEVSRLHRGARP